ncbi:MAG TPA: crosslink repair DNA glycosylase YcaQ family protein [Nitriliruptorales bacterium]|nr:crosslink repair DNA glycosylase YcaQ family protein [Nitriliruptorales bacterium]
MSVAPTDAVAFRVAGHGLDERRSPRSSLAAAARIALPDYPKGAALRALAARRAGVHVGSLDEALARGTLVRAPSLRGTTHVFAASDAALYTVAVLPTPGDEHAARAAMGSAWPPFEALGIAAVDVIDRVTRAIVDVVDDGRPRSKGAISEALHSRLPEAWEPWCQRCGVHHVPDPLFRLAVIAAGLRFTGAGHDSSELVAASRPDPAEHPTARAELVRRFLAAYAPAPARALAVWSGLGPADAGGSVAALVDEVVQLRLDGRPALALAADVDRLLHPPAPTGVRLVPAGDPFLHQRDRATLLPDPEHRRRLWRAAGAPGLVLHDAAPGGVWRQRRDDHHLVFEVELWAVMSTEELRPAIEAEAAVLAAAQAVDPGDVRLRIDM